MTKFFHSLFGILTAVMTGIAVLAIASDNWPKATTFLLFAVLMTLLENQAKRAIERDES